MSTMTSKMNISCKDKLKDFTFKDHFTTVLFCVAVCVIAIVILGIANNIPDTDTFFILSTGEYIVEHKEIPTTNPFVIHEDFDIIIQQWGFDVILYLVYSVFGYPGLFVCTSILFLLAIVLLDKLIGIYTNNINIRLILLSIAAWIYQGWAVLRPTSVSFCLLLSAILIMEYYRRDRKQWLLTILPVISLVLVNMHSSMWPLMFVVMLPFVCPNIVLVFDRKMEYLREWARKWWKVLAIMPIMIAIGFINPNGIKGMSYVILSYGIANRVSIYELMPPYLMSLDGVFIMLLIFTLIYHVVKNKKQLDSANCYMAAGTAFLAMSHVRNVWFGLFGALPLFARFLEDVDIKILQKQQKVGKIKMVAALLIICIVVGITATNYTFYVQDSSCTPLNAANYLDQFINQEDIVLYTDFNNGAYMEFRGYKVYMDARPELFSDKINNKEDVLGEWLTLNASASNAEYVFEKYGFSHIIVEKTGALYGYMQNHPDFEEMIHGVGYVMYQRIDWKGDSKYVHGEMGTNGNSEPADD